MLASATPDVLVAAPEAVLAALGTPEEHRFAFPTASDQPGQMLRAGSAVGRWARAQGADLLHGHGVRWSPLFAAAALRSGLPLVVTLHNLVPTGDDMALLPRIVLRTTLSRARRLIAVSEAVARSTRASLGSLRRLVVVRNGVDLSRFDDSVLPDREEIRRTLGMPRNAPLAMCAARLSPEKGVAAFLEAAALVQQADAWFLVAGDGPLRPSLEQQIGLLGLTHRARLLGLRQDIPDLMRTADLLCVPSREEGLGLAAIEAMASGLPVVATHVGGLPEVVVDGETGFLVAPGDRAALAAAMTGLLANPEYARRLGRAGRERARAHFSHTAMTAATGAIYAEVLGGCNCCATCCPAPSWPPFSPGLSSAIRRAVPHRSDRPPGPTSFFCSFPACPSRRCATPTPIRRFPKWRIRPRSA
jgi:glycosyltransferase involved in cell wall biosynthesis